jgi:hypothetical protein
MSKPIIDAGDMSGALQSAIIPLGNLKNFGIAFYWTGTPTGTLTVSIATDNDPDLLIDLSLSGLTPAFNQPAGGAGKQWFDLETNASFLRVSYAPTSGTGSLDVYLGAKQ